MTPKLTLFISCLLFQLNGIFGQAPGYLGKKIFVKANMYFTPAIYKPTASNKSYSGAFGGAPSSLGFNTRLGLQGGYTLSRASAVTLGGDFLKTGMTSIAIDPKTNNYYSLFNNLKGITTDIGYQVYKPQKGAIAPLGIYVSYHLMMTRLTGSIVNPANNTQDPIKTTNEALNINPHFTNYYFGMEWGKNAVFFDRLLLSTSFRFNVPFNFVTALRASRDGVYYSDATYNQLAFNNNVAARMLHHSLFMLGVGIGILP